MIDTLLSHTRKAAVPWARTLVAVIIALPMFFEIGLVLLLPVIVLVTQRSGHRLMRMAIPALAGLSVLPGLVPPHPGPLIAISAVHVKLGTTLAFGILVAIPTVVICGPLLGLLIARWVPVWAPRTAGGVDLSDPHATADGGDAGGRSWTGGGPASARGGTATAVAHHAAPRPDVAHRDVVRRPSFLVTLLTIICPVVLMLLKALPTSSGTSRTRRRRGRCSTSSASRWSR